ncbi:hypothetical protein KEM54_006212 [Ascosphaera aggregata]|nr:hypothetical protein KEM54_006212 [Ascosphaera aggregata]
MSYNQSTSDSLNPKSSAHVPLMNDNTPGVNHGVIGRATPKLASFGLSNQGDVPANPVDQLLARLTPGAHFGTGKLSTSSNADILAKLSEQQAVLGQQQKLLTENQTRHQENAQCNGSPSNSQFTAPRGRPLTEADGNQSLEMLRLKQELVAANSRIAIQEQELAQSRVIKQTFDHAISPPPDPELLNRDMRERTFGNLQTAFNNFGRPFDAVADTWTASPDDAASDISDSLSVAGYSRARAIWNNPVPSNAFGPANRDPFPMAPVDPRVNWTSRITQPGYHLPGIFSPPPPRNLSNPREAPSVGADDRFTGEQVFLPGANPRGPPAQVNRTGTCFPLQNSPWTAFSSVQPIGRGAAASVPYYPQQVSLYNAPTYQPQPIGTPLSPTAAEFTSANTTRTPSTLWESSASTAGSVQTYVSPLEPLNYRRLLDKNVSCDWKYIVDKIVCSNDQQASIFLQQKLKVGTIDQKYEIVDSIVNQAYPLMVNRFGNFLVQRCFEHGTPEQIIAIANAIRGNTLNLSMDPFGCHVVQKAFDCVPEEYKAMMVHELLRRIPETVIHRYACHVWQKLFELRWSGEPPQIMAKVNEALRGMWHEVALGETGSLVVQNIFENCVEDEKRQAIEEVLAKIDLLAHGQFGNWCIQHICEHGAPQDKSRAIEHILANVTDYSMDQFASKVVEKCLKIGGSEFLDRYLSRVCTGRVDRPRMPLIDIAGDQYGNYLVQWILMNSTPHQREVVATHIRKHMVSLRGSKFGSRVAMLCCNPNHATRPGPGVGAPVNRYSNSVDERLNLGPPVSRFGGRNNNETVTSTWSTSYPPFR